MLHPAARYSAHAEKTLVAQLTPDHQKPGRCAALKPSFRVEHLHSTWKDACWRLSSTRGPICGYPKTSSETTAPLTLTPPREVSCGA